MNKAAHQPDELPRRDVLKGALRPAWDFQPSRTPRQMPPKRQRLPVLKRYERKMPSPARGTGCSPIPTSTRIPGGDPREERQP